MLYHVQIFIGIINPIELLFEVKYIPQNSGHFREFFDLRQVLDKKLECLDDDLLSKDHHDFMLESFAKNHILDSVRDEFLNEIFLRLLISNELLELKPILISKLDPQIAVNYIR